MEIKEKPKEYDVIIVGFGAAEGASAAGPLAISTVPMAAGKLRENPRPWNRI